MTAKKRKGRCCVHLPKASHDLEVVSLGDAVTDVNLQAS